MPSEIKVEIFPASRLACRTGDQRCSGFLPVKHAGHDSRPRGIHPGHHLASSVGR